MFAWAKDGIFPNAMARIHRSYHTPYLAIILSGAMATLGILGSHFAGDFFLGIDILVTSMLVNFLLMCLSVFFLRGKNPSIAKDIKVVKSRSLQLFVVFCGTLTLITFLIVHVIKDMNAEVDAWYFHSTPIWLLVMGLASLIYFREISKLKKKGIDTQNLFSKLPPE